MSLKTQGYIGTASCPCLPVNGSWIHRIVSRMYIFAGRRTYGSLGMVNPGGYHMGVTKPEMGVGDPNIMAVFVRDKIIIPGFWRN